MQAIPLTDAPSQVLSAVLGGQSCTIKIATRRTSLFIDLYVNNVLVVGSALCRNGILILRETYLGFVGDLMFVDTQGSSDPSYPGLGSRYTLLYVTPADIASAA